MLRLKPEIRHKSIVPSIAAIGLNLILVEFAGCEAEITQSV